MKTLHRITTAVIGTSLALTPMLALADTNSTDQNESGTSRGGFLSGLLHRGEDNQGAGIHADIQGSTSVNEDGSTTGKMHKDKEGKDGKNAEHMNQGAHVEAHADASIDGRISALEKISARLNGATKLSADEKASFVAMIQTQIDALTALKAKIGNDTSTSTMRDDAGTIRTEFRTYALVLPRTAIVAASDRILSVASNMETVGTKLNARIDATTTSTSVNVTAARASYTDYVAKVADAKVQAQAAASLVANLTPDNGNATLFASNTASLKAAKVKLDAASADLKAARQDMKDIMKDLKISGEAHATTSAQSST